MRRSVIIVLDGLGVGALPDAADYGDAGSDTLGNTARAVGGLHLPNLEAMGLGGTGSIPGVRAVPPSGAAGRMAESSPGKDTLTGHWELAGLETTDPIPTYPNGFPPEMVRRFEAAIGVKVLGNRAASGTVIIDELGPEHLATGDPIVYTSADSVFQIAAHEEVIPLERLYAMCEVARGLYRRPPHLVGRIIARPFVGRPGAFTRTAGRHDYSLPPPGPTLLEDLSGTGHEVVAVGKVNDIFAGVGITKHLPAAGNEAVVRTSIEAAEQLGAGLIFANLVDFDMVYGHRNDAPGLARALEAFDRVLPELRRAVLEHSEGGLLVVTADHGCDPTTPGTDHSREYVPVLIEGTGLNRRVDLGTRTSFADLAASIAELFGLTNYRGSGRSFATLLTGGHRLG